MKPKRLQFYNKNLSNKSWFWYRVLIMLPMYLLFCECNRKNGNIKGSGPYVNDVPKHAQCLLNRSLALYIFEWHTKNIFRVNAYVRSFWCLWFLSIEGQKYCHAKSEFIVFSDVVYNVLTIRGLVKRIHKMGNCIYMRNMYIVPVCV